MNKPLFLNLVFATVLLAFNQPSIAEPIAKPSQPFVVSGVIINSDNAGLISRFVDYLSKKANYPMHVVYVKKYSELSRVLRNNPKAVGWTCGAPFVQDHKNNGQQLVSIPLFNKKPTYHSVILTQKNRTEKKLSDFKGGILAYSDPRSNSGFLSPKYALFEQGIIMQDHFRLLLNSGNHEGSISALIDGIADVAAVDEYVWDAYLKIYPKINQVLREVERMGPYPFTPIVTGQSVNEKTLRLLSESLLNMPKNEAGRKLLSEFNFDGFVTKSPQFYNPIRDMLKKVDIDEGV